MGRKPEKRKRVSEDWAICRCIRYCNGYKKVALKTFNAHVGEPKLELEQAECSYAAERELACFFHIDKTCHGCRGNSKDSPNCLCGIIPSTGSTRKHGLWQKLSDALEFLGPDPAEAQKCNLDLPSGLTNLGATCYVNSVLQCLYMNTAFRDGIFAAETELLKNQPVLRQLALIFAELHSGKKISVDSASFASTLELDSAVQQDGQEFLKLLLTLLERILSHSRVHEARNLVQNVFRGTFSYVTKCANCGKDSDASNQFVDFYELEVNVKGFGSLEESLDDYLSEENLQGENQYFCEYCKIRVDATHSTKLRLLPPVLNFQLKRFVFNAKTATKKKVTSKFSFPKIMDMGSRVSPITVDGPTRETTLYDLSAILVHKGALANSGHYIAHIKDDRTGEWWLFDDEEVTALGPNPFKEPDAVPNKKSSAKANQQTASEPEVPANENILMSADAYMLMYSRRASSDSTDVNMVDVSREHRARRSQDLPEQLRSEIEEVNEFYLSCCQIYKLRKEEEVKRINELREEVRNILQAAPIGHENSNSIYWISTEWLRNWADNLHHTPPIDNSQLLCEHNNVSHKKIQLMKCISEKAWKELHEKYGGGPVLTRDNCCQQCIMEDAEASAVKDNFRSQRTAMKSKVQDVLNGCELEGELFYVSKTWLTQWMRKKSADAPCDTDAGPTSGLICPHNGLRPEQAQGAKRQLVPEVVWSYFYQNAFQVQGRDLPAHKPFPVSTETCSLCSSELTQQEDLRVTKMEQRQRLEAVYAGRILVLLPGECYYLIPSSWLNKWRSYMRNKLNNDEPVGLEGFILSLVCKHNGLLYKPPNLTKKRSEITQKVSPDDAFTVVSQEDWSFFCEQYEVDVSKGIKAKVMIENNNSNENDIESVDKNSKPPGLTTEPEVCMECVSQRECADLMYKLNYANEEITVDLVEGTEAPPSLLDVPGGLDTTTERRTSRRTRRTCVSGNQRISVTVSGSTTVYHLKLVIWERLGIVKENQKVYLGKKELDDESLTMGDVGVLPGFHLWVSDTGLHENRDIAEELPESEMYNQSAAVEEGFRGTRLLECCMPYEHHNSSTSVALQ